MFSGPGDGVVAALGLLLHPGHCIVEECSLFFIRQRVEYGDRELSLTPDQVFVVRPTGSIGGVVLQPRFGNSSEFIQ